MTFDEKAFIRALSNRPEDLRRFSSEFDPTWLQHPALQIILNEMFQFYKKHEIPPSLKAMETILTDKYPDIYNLRLKPTIEELKEIDLDKAEEVYIVDKATDAMIAKSFQKLASSSEMMDAVDNAEGKKVLYRIENWLKNFSKNYIEESLNIREAIDALVKDNSFFHTPKKIPTGIVPLDDWTNGGLRTKNIGIIVAPTGQGKSVLLMNMAYKIAFIEEEPVWFISNELDLHEQTERFLSRMTKTSMKVVEQDPIFAYKKLDNYWSHKLEHKLRLTYVNKEVSADDIESMMTKHAHIDGFLPKVIIIDYIERMRPATTGWNRDKEWQWIGSIAQDLTRMAKRYNIAIWTAAQTNRAGQNADKILLEMTQSSIRHLQEAAIVVGAHQKDFSDRKVMMFHNLKMRHGRHVSDSLALEIDLDNMYITKNIVDIDDIPEETDTNNKPQSTKITKVKRSKKGVK